MHVFSSSTVNPERTTTWGGKEKSDQCFKIPQRSQTQQYPEFQ